MENSSGKSGGAEISRKARSLDIQSLYKSSVSGKERLNKKKSGGEGDGEVRRNKRKSRKEVPLSSFEPAGKKSRSNLDDGPALESPHLERSLSRLTQELDCGNFNGISVNLDDSGCVIKIPKRRRDFVGRKKFESNRVSRQLVRSPNRAVGSADKIVKSIGECKKLEGNRISKRLGHPCGKATSTDQIVKLNGDCAAKVASPKVRQRLGFDGLKENWNTKVSSAQHAKEDGHVIVNNDNASSRKPRGKQSKRKVFAAGSESFGKKVDPLADSSIKMSDDSQHKDEENLEPIRDDSQDKDEANLEQIAAIKQRLGYHGPKENRSSRASSSRHAKEDGHLVVNNDNASSRKHSSKHRKRKGLTSGSKSLGKMVEPLADSSQDEDEENLEQNAARMLSSRFDPSCTGFSSKSRSSESASTDELSFFTPFEEDFVSHGANLLAGLELATTDTASRVLRPRKRNKEERLSRKRRHFYEILSRHVDACWLLNKRIKVFWPLDESWYYGLVSDYDPERKLHHINYDDRDEEWVNLQNERFKLLLLPSEVPSKATLESVTMGNIPDDDENKDLITDDDSSIGSYMDSEPIISWLVRSSRRVKFSPLDVSKRHKTSHLASHSLPLVSVTRSDDAHCCLDTSSTQGDRNKRSCNSTFLDKFTDASRDEKSVLKGISDSKDGKLPVVYFRRRFRKKEKGLFNAPEDNSRCEIAPVSIISVASFAPDLNGSTKHGISFGDMESEGLLWSVDASGLLKLTIHFIESKQFRFELGSPVPAIGYTFGVENWLICTTLLLQYGTVMTIWPKVHLEMLFVDNVVGLRFLLFEGCLQQAVSFVFLVLTLFYQPNEQGNYVGMQVPVTSIRFKLSRVEDRRKHHAFAFCSCLKVKYSKWLYLDSKLQRHCLVNKQLPLSECTYDNIKLLEGYNTQLAVSSSSMESPAFKGLWRKYAQGVMPTSSYRESCSLPMNQSSSNSDVKHGKVIPFSLSFAAAPTFFLSLHLKLLMENSIASISLWDQNSVYRLEHSENTGCPITNGFTLIQECSESVSEITPEVNPATSLKEDEYSGRFPCAKSQPGDEPISECNDGGEVKPFQDIQNGRLDIVGTSSISRDPAEIASDANELSQNWGCSSYESEQFVTSPETLPSKDHVSADMHDARCLSGLTVEIPSLEQVERSAVGKTCSAKQSANMGWNVSDSFVRSPNPTDPRSVWQRSRNSPSPSFGDISPVWPDGKAEYIRNGFGNGPKRPRTQVQYTLPFGGFDFNSKNKMHNQRGLPFKRIRKANEKRTSDGSRNSHRNLELLACDANVLITIGDRGWRECGARVVLELADHNEWKLAVKLSGTTKYSYKAHQFLQPGSTNRYTHAMMWKGGKDWLLEFSDRSHWMIFKEMHEECYNRNIRAASVKNIPIPGVRLIEEGDDNGIEVPFIRSNPKYFQQVETDVDMAMNQSHVLYDMDSDDERWISDNLKPLHGHVIKCEEISEDLFEKTMDVFEKVAYAQQRDQFTCDEIEEFISGVGPMEAIKIIHEHWQLKRRRKGMPLIRHLQPPLWEKYEQQVKEWEQAMAKANSALFNGCQEKAPVREKPPMFAFCLKPRGLEVPNKGSKQRSQRKFPVPGNSHFALSDQDGLHTFGRRSNGFSYGDEKVVFHGNSHEPSDAPALFHVSPKVFSPRDTSFFSLSSDWSEWNQHSKLHRNKSKKIGTLLSPSNVQLMPSYNQRTIGRRNGIHRWNMGLPEWPSQKHYQSEAYLRHGIEQLDSSDVDEFRLRDASGAAQHALNMAKLKREKAQRLLYRADLAIHKAVVALMTAEAIKASSNGNG